MKYKGYLGRYELDPEAGLFHGQVDGIRDVVTFQGRSAKELVTAFHESVDDYLAFCKERGEAPDKPYRGTFLVRVKPEVHKRLVDEATAEGQSLNTWVVGRLLGNPTASKTLKAVKSTGLPKRLTAGSVPAGRTTDKKSSKT